MARKVKKEVEAPVYSINPKFKGATLMGKIGVFVLDENLSQSKMKKIFDAGFQHVLKNG